MQIAAAILTTSSFGKTILTAKTYKFTLSGFESGSSMARTAGLLPRGGCDDATISLKNGRVVLDFERKGNSLAEVVGIATRDAIAAGVNVDRTLLNCDSVD